MWLKADSLSLSDGDPVGTWADSSGNANNATQSTSAQKPTYKATILNSLPVVRFDGTDDNLNLATNITDGTVTIFIVANKLNTGSYKDILVLSNIAVYADLNNGNFGCYSGGDIDYGSGIGSTHKLLYAKYNAYNDVDLGINGSFVNKTTGVSGDARVASAISSAAGSQQLQGDIAEIIVYDSPLSNANRDSVHEYLRSKYALY